MQAEYFNCQDFSFFSPAQNQLDVMVQNLNSTELQDAEHRDVERYIQQEGFELLRLLLQGHLDKKAHNEPHLTSVTSVNGVELTHVRRNTKRKMSSLFGDVTVPRTSYSKQNQAAYFPIDEQLNLASDQFSDGLRLRIASESIKGSFDDVVETLAQTTGRKVAKRQCLNIVQDVAQDFEAFYEQKRFQEPENTDSLLVLSFDGKGIVLRHEGLRECTQKAALKSTQKLNSRLSAGEKKNRKRMAQVASVYTVQPHIRTPESVMQTNNEESNVHQLRPRLRNKRVWASVERESIKVIEEAFQEALQRDPEQKRQWIILVDGHPHQKKQIKRTMKKFNVQATIVMDFVHVTEYVWKAAWCFFEKDDTAVEGWVAERLLKILRGGCAQVAKGMRSSATKRQLESRENVDKCAQYLLNNKEHLKYGEALQEGFPIGSGVIEGACRHLINDRLDITGARWGLAGAEAILKLRSLKSSGDFNDYWTFHKQKSKERLYQQTERAVV